MLTLFILPFAFMACGFFTIACTIEKYVRQKHS